MSRATLAISIVLMALAAGQGCVGYEPGVVVRVALAGEPDDDAGAPVIEILRAELAPCGGGGHHHHHALRDLLGPSIARAQHQHGGGALVIDAPSRIDLALGGELAGALMPPPGCYDRLTLTHDVGGTIEDVAIALDPPLELAAEEAEHVVTLGVPVHGGVAHLAGALRR